MADLDIQLQYELVKISQKTYEDFLQKAIFDDNFQLIDKILEKIVIPDRVIYWLALRDKCNIGLMKKIFAKKLQYDIFIEQLQNIFQKEYMSHISLDILRQIIKSHYPILNSFNRYYLEKLLVNGDPSLVDRHSQCFSAKNIFLNYKEIDWSIDKAVCEAAYFTQYNFLETLHRAADGMAPGERLQGYQWSRCWMVIWPRQQQMAIKISWRLFSDIIYVK
ncbi:uncharacterized protein LOC111692158 [Anoplophora glabripennis]|uniref:uncharacterized protein LOC111692158 n=1 Tax=Anoplophora glabripennis TaxID=217634 RepID=UPI000C75C277|nr:uncharacterized protein LOC111692158 [Anoplophora glabripennis]